MFQQGIDSDEGIIRRDQESERVRDAREAEVLPISVGFPGIAYNPFVLRL